MCSRDDRSGDDRFARGRTGSAHTGSDREYESEGSALEPADSAAPAAESGSRSPTASVLRRSLGPPGTDPEIPPGLAEERSLLGGPLPGLLGFACIPAFLLPVRAPRWGDLWLVALALVAGIRAHDAARPLPTADDPGAWDASDPVDRTTRVGRWQPRNRRGSLGRLRGAGVDDLLFRLEGAPPAEGDWIAVFPGDPVTPLPRGPVAGPSAREGLIGRRLVRADAWRHLDPDPARAARAVTGSRAAAGAVPLLGPWATSLRGRVRARLEALDEGDTSTALARALVLGESEALPHRFADRTRRAGVRHLFAVSGMHVGLACCLFVLPLARRFGRVSGLASLGAFVVLTGAASPVVRAAIAAGLALLAPRWIRGRGAADARRTSAGPRRVDGATLWGLALALELFGDPLSIRSLGVQLSYAATAGLLLAANAWSRRLTTWTRSRGVRARSLPGTRPSRSSLFVARATRIASGWIAASSAAVLATTSITWTHFGELAPWGIVLTPVALGPVAVVLVCGLLSPFLPSALVAPVLRAASRTLEHLLALVDRWPGTPWPLPERPAWALALLGLGLFTILAAHRRGKPPRAALLVAGCLLLPWTPSPAGFELHVLDSGHGTCAIARGPGLPALVFDAGSRDRTGLYREAIAPLLARWDVAGPVVVLSHDHRDHQSALEELVSRHPPRLWAGADSQAVPLPRGIPRQTLATGRARLARPATRGGPVQAWLHRGLEAPGNEGSVALEVRLRGRHPTGGDPSPGPTLLLLGDAEAEGLEALLAGGGLPGPVELLLAPHHGSDTPLLADLLAATTPRRVWVPAAGRPPIAAELERRGLAWHEPATAGPLTYRWPPTEPP